MQDWTINARIEKKHLIAEIDGHLLLIDTGAPTSFGACTITWEDETVDLAKRFQPRNIESLSSRVGLQLEGLIGCDLLLQRGLRIDIPNGELTFHDELPSQGDISQLRLIGTVTSVPAITSYVAGESTDLVVDTGAMQTFVCEHHAQGLRRVGTVEDFFPAGGDFTSYLVEMLAVVDGETYEIKPAVLPPGLESQLSSMYVTGIIGLDILQTTVFELAPNLGYMSPMTNLMDSEN